MNLLQILKTVAGRWLVTLIRTFWSAIAKFSFWHTVAIITCQFIWFAFIFLLTQTQFLIAPIMTVFLFITNTVFWNTFT